MRLHRIPPRQKKPGEKSKIAEDTKGKHPGEDKNSRTRPDGDNNAQDSGNPSAEEVTRWQKPVTNQDEQEKITNAGADDIPVADK